MLYYFYLLKNIIHITQLQTRVRGNYVASLLLVFRSAIGFKSKLLGFMNAFSLAYGPCLGKDHSTTLLWSPGESLSPNCAVCQWVSKKQPCEIHHHIYWKEIAEWTLLHCLLFCLFESLGDCVYSLHIKNSSASVDQVVQFYGVDTSCVWSSLRLLESLEWLCAST